MVVSEFHCATLSMSNVNTNCDIEIIIPGNKPVLLNQVLSRKFNAKLFCTYNQERTYYHRPYNHISAYTKYP